MVYTTHEVHIVNSKEMRVLLTRKLHIIALAAVVCAAAVYGYLNMPEETTYTCTASMLVSKAGKTAEQQTFGDSLREVAAGVTYMLNTKSFINGVLEEQGMKRSDYTALSATLIKDSSVIELVATGKSPGALEKLTAAIFTKATPKAEELNIRISVLEAGKAVKDPPAQSGALRNALLAFVAGALLAACAILLRYYFTDNVKNEGEVLEATGLPTVARLPEARHDDVDAQLPDMPKSYREQVGRLAFYAAAGHAGPTVMAVVNVAKADERPMAAFRLAEMLAYKGSRVLLLIMDQNIRPGELPYWKACRHDLSEFLAAGADANGMAVEAEGRHGMKILWVTNLPAMFDDKTLDKLGDAVAALKVHYDYVVLRLPAVDQYPDLALRRGLADRTFLAASAFHTKALKLVSAAAMARASGIDAAGFILTRTL